MFALEAHDTRRDRVHKPDSGATMVTGGPTGHDEIAGARGFDPSKPNPARIYDYLLGGKDHFAADRRAAQRLVSALPDAARAARANRVFLTPPVRDLARPGLSPSVAIRPRPPTPPTLPTPPRPLVPH